MIVSGIPVCSPPPTSRSYGLLTLPGTRTTDLTDIIWADHDVEKLGAIEDLIDHPDFEDRWVWSCCGELGSDDGCKCRHHKVPEEFEEEFEEAEEEIEGAEETEERPSESVSGGLRGDEEMMDWE